MKLTLQIAIALLALVVLSSGQTAQNPVPGPAAGSTPQENAQPAATAPPVIAPPADQATVPPMVASVPKKPVNSKPAPKPKGGKNASISTAEDAAEDAKEASQPYVIGSLDVLQISVWNDPKLSGTFGVSSDGMVSMQLIGEVKADGLTVKELTAVIRQKLMATVMNDPDVNVQVARNNSKKYTILGGCARQGEFPLLGEMTIMDAFANCGGFKDFANLKKIYVLRGEQKLPFNYKEVSQGKHLEQNRRLKNGDRIFVPE